MERADYTLEIETGEKIVEVKRADFDDHSMVLYNGQLEHHIMLFDYFDR